MNYAKKSLVLVASIALLAVASTSIRRTWADEAKKTEVKKSELRNQMEDMDDDFKKLKRTVRKAEQNEQSLKLLTAIQQRMVACKEMTPERAAKIPEADRAKFLAHYRKEMAGVIIDFCQVEQAILDGDNPKATELYKAIVEREDKAHDVFMEKDEKKKKE
jgi:hypothetical protein